MFDPPPANLPHDLPDWFQAQLQQMQGLQQQMLLASTTALVRHQWFTAMMQNTRARAGAHHLVPLCTVPPIPANAQPDLMLSAGPPPPQFPATLRDAHNLSAADYNALLAAYDLPVVPDQPVAVKRATLCVHFGCILPIV